MPGYHQQIAIVVLGVLAFALFSRRLRMSVVSLPLAFTAFGWVLGPQASGLLAIPLDNALIHAVAEITLVLVLFSDASRVMVRDLLKQYAIPARMLLLGMPATFLLGSLLAYWVSPDQPWAVAMLLAAILTPTDAALGQAVVNSASVPVRVRQGLAVESGLNDGLALPAVVVAAFAAAAAAGLAVDDRPDDLVAFALKQVALGPLAGAAIGYAGARALDLAIERSLATTVFQGIYFLGIALLAFACAELVGGNGLIAAFVGGLVFGNRIKCSCDFIDELMESEGKLLTMFTFLVFGAVLVPMGIEHMTWKTVVFALVYVFAVRTLPVWLSLAGAGLASYDRIFLAWFGPKGLASILFMLLVLERFPIPGHRELVACVVLTVLLSIVLHGLSAVPMSARFKRRGSGAGE